MAALLEGMVVLEIDTDQHPELARAFGVSAVPDIILATPAGGSENPAGARHED